VTDRWDRVVKLLKTNYLLIKLISSSPGHNSASTIVPLGRAKTQSISLVACIGTKADCIPPWLKLK